MVDVQPAPRKRRHHRYAIAARLQGVRMQSASNRALVDAFDLTWDELCEIPQWVNYEPHQLGKLQLLTGAFASSRAIRRWIDKESLTRLLLLVGPVAYKELFLAEESSENVEDEIIFCYDNLEEYFIERGRVCLLSSIDNVRIRAVVCQLVPSLTRVSACEDPLANSHVARAISCCDDSGFDKTDTVVDSYSLSQVAVQ